MVEVSTPEQFLTEIKKDNNTVNVTSDIDFNTLPITSSITLGLGLTVNGNGHSVYNLQTGTVLNQPMFRSGNSSPPPVFNQINFYNMFRNEGQVFFSSFNDNYITFNECNFQGRGYALFEDCVLNKCAINWESTNGYIGFNSSKNITWTYCYINIKVRTNINKSLLPKSEYSSCYFGGEYTYTGTNSTYNIYPTDSSMSSCVLNIEDKSTGSGLSLSSLLFGTTSPSVINTTKAKKDGFSKSGLLEATDAEMKNAQALYDKGFNIIVT